MIGSQLTIRVEFKKGMHYIEAKENIAHLKMSTERPIMKSSGA